MIRVASKCLSIRSLLNVRQLRRREIIGRMSALGSGPAIASHSVLGQPSITMAGPCG